METAFLKSEYPFDMEPSQFIKVEPGTESASMGQQTKQEYPSEEYEFHNGSGVLIKEEHAEITESYCKEEIEEETPNASLYDCFVCGSVFTRMFSRWWHLRSEHGIVDAEVPTDLIEDSDPILEEMDESDLDTDTTLHVAISCDVCGSEFQSTEEYETHYNYLHKDQDAANVSCKSSSSVNITKLCTLNTHLTNNRNPARQPAAAVWRCSECGNVFDKKCGLYRHYRRVHGIGHREYACGFCKQNFISLADFEKHSCAKPKLKRIKKPPLQCPDCDIIYFKKCFLTRHQNCCPKRTYSCQKCQIKFPTNSESIEHYKKVHLPDMVAMQSKFELPQTTKSVRIDTEIRKSVQIDTVVLKPERNFPPAISKSVMPEIRKVELLDISRSVMAEIRKADLPTRKADILSRKSVLIRGQPAISKSAIPEIRKADLPEVMPEKRRAPLLSRKSALIRSQPVPTHINEDTQIGELRMSSLRTYPGKRPCKTLVASPNKSEQM